MTSKKSQLPETIDAYIAEFPNDVREKLERILAVIAKAAPGADQSISYRIPTFKLAGQPLLYFAAFKAHIGLYPVTDDVKAAFEKELAPFRQSKGTVRFPLDKPAPYALIGKIAKFKVKENAEAAKVKSKPIDKPRAAGITAVRKKKA
jgi:uncharacterized protein YdhG (YjbR/CyaY superfamily)